MKSIQLTIDNKHLEVLAADQYGNYHVHWHRIGIGYIYIVGFKNEDASPIWCGSTILTNSYAMIMGGIYRTI